MQNILLIDNYGSFTHNLKHLFEATQLTKITTVSCETNDFESIAKYDKIILSPGPGLPHEAGSLLKIIQIFAPTKKIFGVCLGMQAIATCFDSPLKNLEKPMHGVASKICIQQKNHFLFADIPDHFLAARYHSWVVDTAGISSDLSVLASDEKGEIMAIQHQKYALCGVQFHPESVLTEYALVLAKNFCEL